MSTYRRVLIAGFFYVPLLLVATCPAKAVTFRVAVFADQLTFFENMLRHDRCPDFAEAGFGVNQMLLEYLFVCHALQKGYENVEIQLVGLPVVHRVVDALSAGNADLSGFGIWAAEGKKARVYQSVPLLQKGEFAKGLFGTRRTHQRLNEKFNGDLSKLVAVSNENWTYDWAGLECAGMRLIHVNQYEQMFRVVGAGRADILALAFGKDETLEREEFGIKLYPIEKYRLIIPDSNHVLISERHPDFDRLSKVIDEGLKALRADNTIRNLYRQAGVLNPYVAGWQGICAR